MTATLLPAVEIETAPDPDATVLFLHGLGDDGHGWSGMVPVLRLPTTLRVRFLFPHAPVLPVTLNGGYVMPAWYDLQDGDFGARADLAGVRASQARVEALLAREYARGVRPGRVVLGGFSQGGVIALHAGLRHAQPLAGIVALSTYLVGAEALRQETAPANRAVPVFMAHGTADDVVLPAWGEAARDALFGAGHPVEWHAYPMGHEAAPAEIVALAAFLARVLAS
jgi:phospholipase/carboxylesterase